MQSGVAVSKFRGQYTKLTLSQVKLRPCSMSLTKIVSRFSFMSQ
jgi:hypothetical protein